MEHKKTKEETFEDIYRTFQNDVYKISLYYTRDEYMAQDIAQKVFYEFYRHMEKVNTDSVRAYLIRSARNMCYNWARSVSRARDGEFLDAMSEENMPSYSTEDEYIKEEKEREIVEFTKGLLQQLRLRNILWYEIIEMIYFLEMPHNDVAQELGITRESLYSNLYRAKSWIRKQFESEYKYLEKP